MAIVDKSRGILYVSQREYEVLKASADKGTDYIAPYPLIVGYKVVITPHVDFKPSVPPARRQRLWYRTLIYSFIRFKWRDFQSRINHREVWPAGFPLWMLPRVSSAMRALTYAVPKIGLSFAEAEKGFLRLAEAMRATGASIERFHEDFRKAGQIRRIDSA